MRLLRLLWLICGLLSSLIVLAEEGDEASTSQERVSLEYELDAYYSNVGLYINLTDEPIRDAGEASEGQIYSQLLRSSLLPRILVLEAGYFPMPNLGVYIKEHHQGFYEDAQFSQQLNLVKAVTAGFEEPYALSLFLGNVIRFTKPGEKAKNGNFGYMGYLLSCSDYHIKDNELIQDDNCEVEWKVKGDREFSNHQLNWSFRVGAKLHSHTEIQDTIYLSLRRSRVDFEGSVSSFLENSGFEYTVNLDKESMEPIRHYFMLDKKLPWAERRLGASLGVGFVWDSARKYSGSLKKESDGNELQFLIRPNIIF